MMDDRALSASLLGRPNTETKAPPTHLAERAEAAVVSLTGPVGKVEHGHGAAADPWPTGPAILRATVVAMMAGCSLCGATPPAFAAGPFADFAGAWRGAGTLSMTDGSRAAIRCKATYAVNLDGNAMNIDINCASDSYRVNVVIDVLAQITALSGQWRETTRQVQGSVSGEVPGPGRLQASLEGTGFGMQLSARSAGRRQSIAIRSEGTDVQGATIELRR